jgi:hypothetical protein
VSSVVSRSAAAKIFQQLIRGRSLMRAVAQVAAGLGNAQARAALRGGRQDKAACE